MRGTEAHVQSTGVLIQMMVGAVSIQAAKDGRPSPLLLELGHGDQAIEASPPVGAEGTPVQRSDTGVGAAPVAGDG